MRLPVLPDPLMRSYSRPGRRLRLLLGYKPSEQRLPWSLLTRADHPVWTLARGPISMTGRVLPAIRPVGARGEEDSAEVRDGTKILLIWKFLPPSLRRHQGMMMSLQRRGVEKKKSVVMV